MPLIWSQFRKMRLRMTPFSSCSTRRHPTAWRYTDSASTARSRNMSNVSTETTSSTESTSNGVVSLPSQPVRGWGFLVSDGSTEGRTCTGRAAGSRHLSLRMLPTTHRKES